MTFTDKLRIFFGSTLSIIGGFLFKIGLRANTITLLGVAGNAVATFYIARGDLLVGGVLVVLTGPLDALDGTLARFQDDLRPFGALFDSLADRFSEGLILLGLLIYFLDLGSRTGCVLTFVALTGSLLVSYIRARAQSLGCDVKIGLLTRVERYIIISLALLFSQPLAGLWLLATLTYVTIIQRVWFAWKELH